MLPGSVGGSRLRGIGTALLAILALREQRLHRRLVGGNLHQLRALHPKEGSSRITSVESGRVGGLCSCTSVASWPAGREGRIVASGCVLAPPGGALGPGPALDDSWPRWGRCHPLPLGNWHKLRRIIAQATPRRRFDLRGWLSRLDNQGGRRHLFGRPNRRLLTRRHALHYRQLAVDSGPALPAIASRLVASTIVGSARPSSRAEAAARFAAPRRPTKQLPAWGHPCSASQVPCSRLGGLLQRRPCRRSRRRLARHRGPPH